MSRRIHRGRTISSSLHGMATDEIRNRLHFEDLFYNGLMCVSAKEHSFLAAGTLGETVTPLMRFLGAITTGCMRPFVPRTNKNEITTTTVTPLMRRGGRQGKAKLCCVHSPTAVLADYGSTIRACCL